MWPNPQSTKGVRAPGRQDGGEQHRDPHHHHRMTEHGETPNDEEAGT